LRTKPENQEDLKIIVLLYYFEDLSVKAISKITDIPEGTIKSRLHRARTHLYQKLSVDERSCQNE
jgi:RNA polymerase sigma-70 factor (ECF subfamily)